MAKTTGGQTHIEHGGAGARSHIERDVDTSVDTSERNVGGESNRRAVRRDTTTTHTGAPAPNPELDNAGAQALVDNGEATAGPAAPKPAPSAPKPARKTAPRVPGSRPAPKPAKTSTRR